MTCRHLHLQPSGKHDGQQECDDEVHRYHDEAQSYLRTVVRKRIHLHANASGFLEQTPYRSDRSGTGC